MRSKSILKLIFCVTTIVLISQSCAPKRCKGRQCTTRMVHFHDGDEYRGVSLWYYLTKAKNPRYGFGYAVPKIDPSAKQKKSKKENKNK